MWVDSFYVLFRQLATYFFFNSEKEVGKKTPLYGSHT